MNMLDLVAGRPKILKHDDPQLRQPCLPVEGAALFDLPHLVHAMVGAMRYPAGVGLAAPQVGVALRVIVVCVPHGNTTIHYEIANPEIYWTSKGLRQDWEGCLSFPTGYRALVPRHQRIKVRGLDASGDPVQFGARDFVARVIQHEIDHLDGVLITDKATRIDQRKVKEGQTIIEIGA